MAMPLALRVAEVGRGKSGKGISKKCALGEWRGSDREQIQSPV